MTVQKIEKRIDSKKFPVWDKVIYTTIISLNLMTIGLTGSLFGPALVDLKYILNTSMSWISLIKAFQVFGYLIGTLCGFLYKYVNRQIATIVQIVLLGVITILVPYSKNLWTLYLYFWIYGFGCGASNNATNVWLIEMWQKNNAPVLLLSQFMFGLGSIFGPLLEKPYLTGEHFIDHNHTYSFNLSAISANQTPLMTEDIDRRSKLKTPFLMNGSIQLMGPILMAIMFVMKRYRYCPKSTEENDESSKQKLFHHKSSRRMFMIILLSTFVAFYCLSEATFLRFNATYYQYIPLRLTASKSAEVVSMIALCYTVGRGISVFVSFKIRSEHMITYHLFIVVIALIVLFFGQNSIYVLWAGSLSLGFGFSSIFPSILSFISQHIQMTNRIGTILTFSSSILTLFSPYILGTFIEKYPQIFIYSIAASLSISILLFIFILYSIRKTEKYNSIYINNNNDIETQHQSL